MAIHESLEFSCGAGEEECRNVGFCIDYWQLKAIIHQDALDLLRIEETIDSLHVGQIFSCLDLKSGYW